MDDGYDVVVVGGGAAGLSAAVVLARSRRSVLVVDGGSPRNAPADGVHNYLGRESAPPAELLAAGRADVQTYGGEVVDGTVTSAKPAAGPGGGFRVELADGRSVQARRLLLATGLRDELPAVPGLAERWGRDVLHCPYCHGWEVRDQAIGVLATGPTATHQALLFRQLSSDVVLMQHTGPQPTAEERAQLQARGIAVVAGEVAGVEVAADRLTGVRLSSGEFVARDAVAVAPRFIARTELLDGLGLHTEEFAMDGNVLGTRVPADPRGATAVDGVWVAGNVTDLFAGVMGSAAAGYAVGVQLNADLVTADTRSAMAAGGAAH